MDQLKQQAEAQQKLRQSQSQSQQTQMGNQKDAQVVAEAMAGLMMEEELGETDELKNHRRKNGHLNAKSRTAARCRIG